MSYLNKILISILKLQIRKLIMIFKIKIYLCPKIKILSTISKHIIIFKIIIKIYLEIFKIMLMNNLLLYLKMK